MEETMMVCKICKEVTEHVYSESDHCWICLVCVNGGNRPKPEPEESHHLDLLKKNKVISFEAFRDRWTVADSKQADDRLKRDKDSS